MLSSQLVVIPSVSAPHPPIPNIQTLGAAAFGNGVALCGVAPWPSRTPGEIITTKLLQQGTAWGIGNWADQNASRCVCTALAEEAGLLSYQSTRDSRTQQ